MSFTSFAIDGLRDDDLKINQYDNPISLQPGELGQIEYAHEDSGPNRGTISFTLSKCDLLPKLVGDYTLKQLRGPKVTYFISLSHADGAVVLQTGAVIVTHVIQFDPVGYDVTNRDAKKTEPAFARLATLDDTIYYVREVQYGGSYTLSNRFVSPQGASLLTQMNFEFMGDEDGVNGFKEKLSEIAWHLQQYELEGAADNQQSPSLNTEGRGFIVPIKDRKSKAHGPVAIMTFKEFKKDIKVFVKDCKKMAKRVAAKKKRPTSRQKLEKAISRLVDEIFAGLENYVASYLQVKPVGSPQVSVARIYPVAKDASSRTYEMLEPDMYIELMPDTLAEKYTVEVFQLLGVKDNKIHCWMQIYPSPRGQHHRVIRNDVTWIGAASEGDVLDDAVQAALDEIEKRQEL